MDFNKKMPAHRMKTPRLPTFPRQKETNFAKPRSNAIVMVCDSVPSIVIGCD